MSYSLQLFDEPMTDHEIKNPHICENLTEVKNRLKQSYKPVMLTQKQENECLIGTNWLKSGQPFTGVFVVWRDGNWSFMSEKRFRDIPIAVGQYEKAYYDSKKYSHHFYELETNTSRDLIFTK